MFVSSLFTGSISDKEICRRSGLYSVFNKRMQDNELLKGDAIMADKGFTIEDNLKKLNLTLNIPAFME